MAKKGGKKAAYQATNLAIGQQGSTGTTVYATWTAFSEAQRKNMSGVSVTWKYQVTNSEGKNVWFTGSTESLGAGASQSGTYSAPSESLAVQVSVSPVLTKKGKKKATAQAATAQRTFSANAPAKPSRVISMPKQLFSICSEIASRLRSGQAQVLRCLELESLSRSQHLLQTTYIMRRLNCLMEQQHLSIPIRPLYLR